MTKETLGLIDSALTELGVNYAFMEMGMRKIVYPYFVGEYSENAPLTEDGLIESTFMLNGFTRGLWLELEEQKEIIERYFNSVSGISQLTASGMGVCIAYENALVIPTGDAELKRIQINLSVKEWRVEI